MCYVLFYLFNTLSMPLTLRSNGLQCRTGHNECPLPIIRTNSESPTTFRMMFKAPFWSAFMILPAEERNKPRLTRFPK